jgi:hypothetical protein
LPSNGTLSWFHYFGIQTSRHIAFRSCWTPYFLWGPCGIKLYVLKGK